MSILSLLLSIIIAISTSIIVTALNVDYPRPPNIAIIHQISNASAESMSIHLKMMSDSYLANENLPVWIVRSGMLEPASHVMEDIGPFFMYRDMDTCSAAVYFSKRKQFDGTISNREIFHHVDFNLETNRVATSRSTIHRSKIYHLEQIKMETSNEIQQVTGISESEEHGASVVPPKYVRSRLTYPNTVYIEVFVVVDGDTTSKFENNYASIVSYILVAFNSVDMLYANTISPKIKINIAGILIGATRADFPELIHNNCYETFSSDGKERLNVICAAGAIRDILEDYQDEIKLDSYDIVVFLTGLELQMYSSAPSGTYVTHLLNGYMDEPNEKSYNGYKLSHKHIKVAVVSNSIDGCLSFPVIAHELAHGFNVQHDYGDFRNIDGECTGNLMRSPGSFCEKCLYFSDNTLAQFRRFFGSRDSCIFYNEPKSLHHPLSEPQKFWTEDQQCQCYGYDYSYNSLSVSLFRNYANKIWKPEINCDRRLECVRHVNGERVTEKTAYYMNGTPCTQNNKVCWNRKCKTSLN